ncbi:MAG: BtpA/SgcQ family protein [Holdemania massiliensis]
MGIKEVFKTTKPVIGMMHLMALPTDPKYDPQGGIQKVLNRARADLQALQEGGIDAILFCNEYSIPYLSDVHPVTIACMARIIGELIVKFMCLSVWMLLRSMKHMTWQRP